MENIGVTSLEVEELRVMFIAYLGLGWGFSLRGKAVEGLGLMKTENVKRVKENVLELQVHARKKIGGPYTNSADYSLRVIVTTLMYFNSLLRKVSGNRRILSVSWQQIG